MEKTDIKEKRQNSEKQVLPPHNSKVEFSALLNKKKTLKKTPKRHSENFSLWFIFLP